MLVLYHPRKLVLSGKLPPNDLEVELKNMLARIILTSYLDKEI